jgi:hypothetical protein
LQNPTYISVDKNWSLKAEHSNARAEMAQSPKAIAENVSTKSRLKRLRPEMVG